VKQILLFLFFFFFLFGQKKWRNFFMNNSRLNLVVWVPEVFASVSVMERRKN